MFTSNLSRLSLRAVMLAVLATCSFGILTSSAGAALPVVYNVSTGLAGIGKPELPPPGANDWSCKPSAAHPNPVILVHGTFANQAENWATLSPLLKNNGYCVFSLTYGRWSTSADMLFGLAPVRDSAGELSVFVDRVRSATGASKVDFVGHSQGGMLPNYYVKFLGGAAKTRTVVGLAPANHSGDLSGLLDLADSMRAAFPPLDAAISSAIGQVVPALNDLYPNSAFMNELTSVPDTVPGVRYTVIASRFDGIVTPTAGAFLGGGGGTIKNLYVQDKCFLDFSEHVSLAFDHVALREVLNALDPANARGTLCSPVLPFIGG